MNNRQRVFISEYLKDFNASRAARSAGYSEKTAYSIGQENLKKPEIKAEIERQIAERSMSKDEILLRLAAHARGDIGEITEAKGAALVVDLEKAKKLGLTHLIKRVRQKVITSVKDGAEVEIVQTEVELYDSKSALDTLAKISGLLVEKTEISGPDGGAIPVEMFEKALKKVYGE